MFMITNTSTLYVVNITLYFFFSVLGQIVIQEGSIKHLQNYNLV